MVILGIRFVLSVQKLVSYYYVAQKRSFATGTPQDSSLFPEVDHEERMSMDLRKLIKYEERMGINTQQNNYFESLFKRTTASYRAKIDKENAARNRAKRKSNDHELPTTSKQAASGRSQRVLQERNQSVEDPKTFYSHDISYSSLGSNSVQQSRHRQGNAEYKSNQNTCSLIDTVSMKLIIKDALIQVLQEKFSQQVGNAETLANGSKEKATTPSKSLVEKTVNHIQQKRFSDLEKYSVINSVDLATLKSITEDIVTQVIQEKLSDFKHSSNGISKDVVDNLNRDLQQKLSISKEKPGDFPREILVVQNTNKSLDSQALVNELLGFEDDNKNKELKKDSKSKPDEKNLSTSKVACIKRLRRSPRKKAEWQDAGRLDGALGNSRFSSNQRPLRARSPTASLTVRSARSRSSSSVMIPRSASQGRAHKPNSDPVALYQYYKNEWDHFRNQIPGETNHNRLRWHVRQRMLDPE